MGFNTDGSIAASQYAGEAEAQALSKRSSLFLPKTEAYLTRILTPKALPFRLLDVEVAPVNFADGSYRAAALRFEVDPTLPDARHMVAQRAATLVKAAFAADPKLDNVDVTGVATGDGAQAPDSLMRFAGDEVPVFTASVQRRNLIVRAPKWANDPNLEGGLWLRTRSRLWIDDRVLPKLPKNPRRAPRPNRPHHQRGTINRGASNRAERNASNATWSADGCANCDAKDCTERDATWSADRNADPQTSDRADRNAETDADPQTGSCGATPFGDQTTDSSTNATRFGDETTGSSTNAARQTNAQGANGNSRKKSRAPNQRRAPRVAERRNRAANSQ